MQERITDTANTELNGFPQVSDAQTGKWATVSDGDWTGGFWVALLWLAHYRNRDETLLRQAEQWAQRLRLRAHSQTVFRCFLFYYGAAIAAILLENLIGRELGLLGAQELAMLYNSRARLVPIGTQAPKAQEAHLCETNVDGLVSTALLGWAAERSGNKALRHIGRAHAARHLELCIRDDGSVQQSARFDPGMLTEGCFNGRTGQSTNNELIWGDYFLFEALLVLTGLLDPLAI
jgi:unsaturated chondroitin disaccharide hydrolase